MNHTIQVSRTLSLTTQDLEGILCSCIEGGSNYWCQIDNTTPAFDRTCARLKVHNDSRLTIEQVIVAMWEDGEVLCVGEDADEDGTFSTSHTISLQQFLHAIEQSILDGYWSGEDICDVDGEVGDVIMQLACFDDVIYG